MAIAICHTARRLILYVLCIHKTVLKTSTRSDYFQSFSLQHSTWIIFEATFGNHSARCALLLPAGRVKTLEQRQISNHSFIHCTGTYITLFTPPAVQIFGATLKYWIGSVQWAAIANSFATQATDPILWFSDRNPVLPVGCHSDGLTSPRYLTTAHVCAAKLCFWKPTSAKKLALGA